MNQFNSIERTVAKALSYTPWLKSFIKGSYQSVSHALNRKDYKYNLVEGLLLKKWAIQGRGSFWGYYDKSPLRDGRCLYHSFDPSRPVKNLSHPINIVLDDCKISSSSTWNWQQGSMLSWLGKGTDWIIHNDFNNGRFISKIISTKGKEQQIIDFPIYQVSDCGSFGLSLNFSRLAKLRPDYGYFNLPTNQLKPIQSDDGIFYVDLKSNRCDLVLSLETISEFQSQPFMQNAWHKINHIMIAPNGKRFMFLHRWYIPGGKKYTRLMTCNIDGTDMHVLADNGMVSHCYWLDCENIVSFARKAEIGDRYFLFKDRSSQYSLLGENTLTEDGHPSISHDQRWMITDTYPDRSRMRKLILFDMHSEDVIQIGEFFEPLKYYGQYRCDLHPRWVENEMVISFDSTFSGIRQMYSMDLSEICH